MAAESSSSGDDSRSVESSLDAWETSSDSGGTSTSEPLLTPPNRVLYVPQTKENVRARVKSENVTSLDGTPIIMSSLVERLERSAGLKGDTKVWRERYAEVQGSGLVIYNTVNKRYIIGTYSLHSAHVVSSTTATRYSFQRASGSISAKGVLKEGFLSKSSGKKVFKKWDRRWFKLGEDKLVYAATQTDTSVKGVIALADVRKVCISTSNLLKDGLAGMDVVTGDRTYVLYGDTETITHEWVEAIQAAMQRCTGWTPGRDERPSLNYFQLFYGDGLKSHLDLRITEGIASVWADVQASAGLGTCLKEGALTRIEGGRRRSSMSKKIKSHTRYYRLYESCLNIYSSQESTDVRERIPLILVTSCAQTMTIGARPDAFDVTTKMATYTLQANTPEESTAWRDTIALIADQRRSTRGTYDAESLALRWVSAIKQVIAGDHNGVMSMDATVLTMPVRPKASIAHVGWLYVVFANDTPRKSGKKPKWEHNFGVLTDFGLYLFKKMPITQGDFETFPQRFFSLLAAECRLLKEEEDQGKKNCFVFVTGTRQPLPICAWDADSRALWIERTTLAARRFTAVSVAQHVSFPVTLPGAGTFPGQLTLTVKREGVEARAEQGDQRIVLWDYSFRQVKSYRLENNQFVLSMGPTGQAERIEGGDPGQTALIMQVVHSAAQEYVDAVKRAIEVRSSSATP